MSINHTVLIQNAKDCGGVTLNYVLWQTTRFVDTPDGQRADSIRYEVGLEDDSYNSYHRIILGRFMERHSALRAFSRLSDWYGEWLPAVRPNILGKMMDNNQYGESTIPEKEK